MSRLLAVVASLGLATCARAEPRAARRLMFHVVISYVEHSKDSNSSTKTYDFNGDRLTLVEQLGGSSRNSTPENVAGDVPYAKQDELATQAHDHQLDTDLTSKLATVTVGTNLTVDATFCIDGKTGTTHLEGSAIAVSALDRYEQIEVILGTALATAAHK